MFCVNSAQKQWRILDFPDGGPQPQSCGPQPSILAVFSWKLQEIETKWTWGPRITSTTPWICQ